MERRALLAAVAGALVRPLNKKTARALGLAIPPSLLQRADHVME